MSNLGNGAGALPAISDIQDNDRFQVRDDTDGQGKRGIFSQVKTWIEGWITKATVGLSDVDNTSDADKPVSTAQQAALDAKLEAGDNVSALANDAGYITIASVPTQVGQLSVGLVDEAGATRTLTDADHGKIIRCSNAGGCVVTVNTGLRATNNDFYCTFIQEAAGAITFAGTATITNRQAHTGSAGETAVISIAPRIATDSYVLGGDTA